jgi:drug/metabolite transporter (DMT)-like permease
MVIHVFERRLGLFLTLCQFLGYALLSAAHRAIHADTPRRIPLGYYLLLAALQATNQGLTNLSMRWLNYPAKMLFKSSRVIPTMAVGILYMRKRYKPRDYLVVALLSLGLACFMRADVKVSPAFHPLGILFICMALAVDAAIVNLQEFTLRKYDASHDELIFYSYGIGSLFLALYCLPSLELWEGVTFLRQEGAQATACLVLFCSCGYFGVTCVAALTKKFGALVSTMTTTARKALTLFLSFFLFPKPATPMHVLGGLLFVVGLGIKAVPGPSRGGRRHWEEGGGGAASSSSSRAALKATHYRALLSSGPAVKGGGRGGGGGGVGIGRDVPPV